jgi:hypothetical protein
MGETTVTALAGGLFMSASLNGASVGFVAMLTY